MRKIWEIIKVILIVFLVLMVAYNGYSLYQRQVKGEPLPMIAGWGTAIIASGSMEPTYSFGDLIVIHRQKNYQVDDVVTFIQEGDRHSTTHRIIAIEGDEVKTQGDANTGQDSPINTKQIYGKVLMKVPFVGTIKQKLSTPLGLLVIMLVFLGMYFYDREKDKEQTDV